MRFNANVYCNSRQFYRLGLSVDIHDQNDDNYYGELFYGMVDQQEFIRLQFNLSRGQCQMFPSMPCHVLINV